jgi:NAD-dependent SIR2 family protein deacetylase
MSAATKTTIATAPDASYNWHGYLLADAGLPPPTCAAESDECGRPQYTKVTSSEYVDSPAVLEAKADLLIQMWSAARFPLVYAGAGISTSSGICDYASRANKSVVQAKKQSLTMPFIRSLQPTPAHRVITALEKRGMVWGWLQQNHDGLAQKAGFPPQKVNELHGAWFDKEKNPVIAMSGGLRGDLFEWCIEMEKRSDFVFVVGTSLSGLNADRVVHTCAKRHMGAKPRGQGVAMISIQRTQHDDLAALRIFSKIDAFMLIVARKLRLTLSKKTHEYAPAPLPVGPPANAEWLAEREAKLAAAAEKAAKLAAQEEAEADAAESAPRERSGPNQASKPKPETATG